MEDKLEQKLLEMFALYEYPARIHGDRISLKLTATDAVHIVRQILAEIDSERQSNS